MPGGYRGPGFDSVAHAAPGCMDAGCQFRYASGLLEEAQRALAERKAIMDQLARYEGILALWCSRGAHSFSELDPGRIVIPPASGRDETGAEIVIPAQAICGEHAKGLGHRRTRPLELELADPPTRYDPDYMADLERENERLREIQDRPPAGRHE